MNERDFIKELEHMREGALIRVRQAQDDLEAIDRILAVRRSNQTPLEPASVEEIRQTTIDVLTKQGESMHRKDIFEKLQNIGIYINGKDPVAGLGTVLSRCSKDFVSQGQGIWGLRVEVPGTISTPSQISGFSGNGENIDRLDTLAN